MLGEDGEIEYLTEEEINFHRDAYMKFTKEVSSMLRNFNKEAHVILEKAIVNKEIIQMYKDRDDKEI